MTTHPPQERTAVLVVGAGLAGLTTAIFLARYGVRATVVERRPSPATGIKATGQYPHAMEVLRMAGVAGRIRELSRADRTEFEMVLADRLAGPVRRKLVSGRELGMRHLSPEEWGTASQAGAETALTERAVELGVDLRFGTRMRSLRQDHDGITVDVEDVTTGAGTMIGADYLVGADGWRSPVRTGSGISMQGRGTVGRVLRVLFKADLSEPLAHTPGAADGSRFTAFHIGRSVLFNTEVPNLFGYFRNLTPELPDGWQDSAESVAREIRKDLSLPAEQTLEIVEIGETEIACAVAERLRAGRVLLAGDAAHVMPPTGGLGGNTAVLDGLYLGWRLAAVVRGWGGPDLLDTYDSERRPYARLLVEQQFANLVERLSPELRDDTVPAPVPPAVLAFGYRYPGGAVVAEAEEDGALLEDPASATGRPGSRAPYVTLRGSGGTPTSTTALFGSGFVLLTGDAGGAWLPAAVRASESLGVPLDAYAIGPASPLRDAEGTFAARYGIGPDGAVLVRPDRFVAWRHPGPADDPERSIAAALRQVLSR